MTKSGVVAAVALCGAFVASVEPAYAQWSVKDVGTELSETPTAQGVASGSNHTLGLTCENSGTPLLYFYGDRQIPRRDGNLSVRVDGRSYALPVRQMDNDPLWTGRPDQALVAALRGGSVAFVQTPNGMVATIPLSGSSAAIGQAMSPCIAGISAVAAPATTGAQAAGSTEPLQALEAALVTELTAECRATGGSTVEFAEGAFARSGQDIIVNFHHITCPGAFGVLAQLGVGNCGAAQCLQRVYSLRNGRYVETRSYWQ